MIFVGGAVKKNAVVTYGLVIRCKRSNCDRNLHQHMADHKANSTISIYFFLIAMAL